MDYNILKNNSNIDSNFNQKNNDKDLIFIKKNIKKTNTNTNTNINHITNLQNKINELEHKLEFYKKYENNLSNSDLKIINCSIEIIDNLIDNFTKNMISKGKVNRNTNHIEFEF